MNTGSEEQILNLEHCTWAPREYEGLKIRPYLITGTVILGMLGVFLTAESFYPNLPVVSVAPAVIESVRPSNVVYTVRGVVVPHHRINVNPKVTGRVSWIGVEKGDKVRQGQVLVRLEDDEFRAQYEQAQGAVKSAKAYLEELEHGSRPAEIREAQHNLDEVRVSLHEDNLTLDRTRRLAAEHIVSPQALEAATARFDADQQRVSSLQNALQLAESGPRPEEIARAQGMLSQAEGQEAYAKSMLEATVIRAPVSGTILERTAEKGELVTAQFASGAEGGPQGEVVALANLRDIQVELNVAQSDFAKISSQQSVLITLDAFPGRKYDGIMAEVSPEANPQNGTIQIRVQVLNPDKYLRPGMIATAHFLKGKSAGSQPVATGAFVPSAAVHSHAGKYFVNVIAGGRIHTQEVEIVFSRQGGVLVRGLQAGKSVVVNGPDGLKENARVMVKQGPGN